jgi:hypothetical protein
VKQLPSDINLKGGGGCLEIECRVNFSRLRGNVAKAQFGLDSMVMASMVPYMPKVTGTFINNTMARSAAVAGTGIVYAAAPPYGRFLYEGKGMVGSTTGSPYAQRGEKKVLVSQYSGKTMAKEFLTYNTSVNPEVQPHWFDVAKERRLAQWLKTVNKTVKSR